MGLITSNEDCPGVLTLDKGYNEMSKFLNRILGMHVEKQNLLFKYFSDTLAAIIQQAKRSGRYDQVWLLGLEIALLNTLPVLGYPRCRNDSGGPRGSRQDPHIPPETRHGEG